MCWLPSNNERVAAVRNITPAVQDSRVRGRCCPTSDVPTVDWGPWEAEHGRGRRLHGLSSPVDGHPGTNQRLETNCKSLLLQLAVPRISRAGGLATFVGVCVCVKENVPISTTKKYVRNYNTT